MSASRSVVLTGAAGGLGSATVRRLAGSGWRVFATDLAGPALDALAGDGVTTIACDVTDESSVAAMTEAVRSQADRLDAVVNFAGILGVGPLVEIAAADFRRVLDVNVVGGFLVNRALFPLLHRAAIDGGSGSGGRPRIVLLSSETGWQSAMPFNGPYAISKHAVEAYGDSLRRELAILGIAVVKIQPGAFKTGMVESILGRFGALADASTNYERVLRLAQKRIPQEERRAGNPADLAALVERVLEAPRPKPAYRIHTNPQAAALDRLPTRVVDRLLLTAFRRANR
ncbi:MAG: SDR family NAD(P)-dependent oxidoreductase [Frankiales bacterium]|nr:SDR family NAD(P)-dependent oxidoreductase [Frankiales bacterium]